MKKWVTFVILSVAEMFSAILVAAAGRAWVAAGFGFLAGATAVCAYVEYVDPIEDSK